MMNIQIFPPAPDLDDVKVKSIREFLCAGGEGAQ